MDEHITVDPKIISKISQPAVAWPLTVYKLQKWRVWYYPTLVSNVSWINFGDKYFDYNGLNMCPSFHSGVESIDVRHMDYTLWSKSKAIIC